MARDARRNPGPDVGGVRVDAVITGGGTSGHVVPALAILEGLVSSGSSVGSLRYVGARRGVETRLVPAESAVECVFLPISGLQRSFSPRALSANLLLPFRLLWSTGVAVRCLRRWRPRVVVSVGGYASEPVARAARVVGVPLVCVSYDRAPGLATRRQARRAVACATAFEDSTLPKSTHTGAPVRTRLRTIDREAERDAARRRFGVPATGFVVAVVGGSLGSRALNEAVPGIMSALAGTGSSVIHVTGPRFHGIDTVNLQSGAGVHLVTMPYCDDMASLYAACDAIVCRAGASTIAEVATVGVAAVIMPWSGAVDDHQTLNARWLVDAGAAVMVNDGDSSQCAREVALLAGDTARAASLASAARQMGSIHRGDALISLIRRSMS